MYIVNRATERERERCFTDSSALCLRKNNKLNRKTSSRNIHSIISLVRCLMHIVKSRLTTDNKYKPKGTQNNLSLDKGSTQLEVLAMFTYTLLVISMTDVVDAYNSLIKMMSTRMKKSCVLNL